MRNTALDWVRVENMINNIVMENGINKRKLKNFFASFHIETCVKSQGQPVKAEDSFTYFGRVFENESSVEKDFRSRTGKA